MTGVKEHLGNLLTAWQISSRWWDNGNSSMNNTAYKLGLILEHLLQVNVLNPMEASVAWKVIVGSEESEDSPNNAIIGSVRDAFHSFCIPTKGMAMRQIDVICSRFQTCMGEEGGSRHGCARTTCAGMHGALGRTHCVQRCVGVMGPCVDPCAERA